MDYNSGESLSPASSQEVSFQRDSKNGSSLSNEIFLDDSQASAKTTGIEALASVAADSSPLGKDKDSQKRRFDALCRKLNVDEQTQSEAWELITKIPSDDNKSEHEEYWFTCGLYTAGCTLGEGKNRKGSGVPLSQILKEAKIRIVDFFDPLKMFVSLLSLDDTNLKHLERKYVVTTMLFTKYDKMFGELMQSPSQTERTNMSIKTRKPDSQLIFSFGWTLFLVAKAKLLSDPSDLVNSLHLLLCCINMQFIHVPSHLRKVSFKDQALVKTGEVNTLLYLCELNSASYTEVLKLHEHLFFPFIQMYHKNGILRCTLPRVPNESSQCKGYLGTLLEGANLQKNFTNITKEYELIYYDTGDIDERLFIDQPELIGTPSKVGAQTRSYYNIRGKPNGEFLSPSKSHTPVPQSPMTVTMETVSWLKRVVGARDDTPGPILEKFFKACDNNISASIQERVKRLVATIPIPEPENEWAEKPRIDIGVKLYYRILENMLHAEEQRLKHNNFATLLSHEGFHRSLLAACLEVILFAYKMSQLAFPFILQKFDIKPFDFCKLIESVVRHEPELPRAVVRHLNSIEEKILESLGWEESSPVFTLLQDANNRAGVLQLLSNAANNSKTGSIQGLASPMPNKIRNSTDSSDNNALHISGNHLAPPSPNFTGSSPPSPSMSSTDAPSAPRRISSHSLELFFRKVFHLASIRCKNLCVGLQLSTKTYHQIWQTLVHVLTEQSSLIKNRHLDQIVMSSIYGVCKVNQLNKITFRVIIEQYRTQPQCNSKIFREVYLGPGGEKSDIIGFYNKFFIPLMEPFLLEFQNQLHAAQEASNNAATASPGRQTLSNSANLSTSGVSLPSQSPHRISATHNLYLSPMRQTRPATNFTVNSLASSSAVKFSFNFGGSFGESPAKDIQYINDTLNSPKGGRSRPKRLFAVEEAQDENAGINSLNSVMPVKRKLGGEEMTESDNFQIPVLTVNQSSAALQTSGELDANSMLFMEAPSSPSQTSSPRRDKSPRHRK